MNLISFQKPTHVYRSDACPWGIGGYNHKGRAWRLEIPEHLCFRATLNMLEFLAACIGPWVDILENNLPPLSCTLSMTDSTTTAGWLRKSNFKDDDENDQHQICKLQFSREHAYRLLINDIKEYSQWFPGDKNDVADSLSRDHHLTDFESASLFHQFLPSQTPADFKISPLPPEIVSWIYSWLQKMPEKSPSREIQQRSKIARGTDGKNFINQLNSRTTSSLKISQRTRESESLEPSQNQSDKGNILKENLQIPWLLQQSQVPWTMWLRPSGTINSMTCASTIQENLHVFYCDSTKAIRTRINLQNNKKLSPCASSNSCPKTNQQ